MRIYFLFFLLSSSILLIQCDFSETKIKNNPHHLIVQTAFNINTIDPIFATPENFFLIQSLYQTLFILNDRNQFEKFLIQDYSIDTLVTKSSIITLNIGSKLFFSDGSPLNAEDIEYSLNRLLNTPKGKILLPGIETILIKNNLSLQILVKPNFDPRVTLYHLTSPNASIVKKNTASPLNVKDFKSFYYIGSGPYIIQSFNAAHIILKKNLFFFKPLPISLIHIHTKNYGLSSDWDVHFGDLSNTETQNKNLVMQEFKFPILMFLGFRIEKNISEKRDLRRGFSYSFDFDEYQKAISYPLELPFFAAQNYYFSKPFSKFRPFYAQELLTPFKSLETTLFVQNNIVDIHTAQFFIKKLKEQNILIKLKILNKREFLLDLIHSRFPLFISSIYYIPMSGDILNLFQKIQFSSSVAAHSITFYDNEFINYQIANFSKTSSSFQKLKILNLIRQQALYDVPFIPLTMLTQKVFFKPYIQNNSTQFFSFQNLKTKNRPIYVPSSTS